MIQEEWKSAVAKQSKGKDRYWSNEESKRYWEYQGEDEYGNKEINKIYRAVLEQKQSVGKVLRDSSQTDELKEEIHEKYLDETNRQQEMIEEKTKEYNKYGKRRRTVRQQISEDQKVERGRGDVKKKSTVILIQYQQQHKYPKQQKYMHLITVESKESISIESYGVKWYRRGIQTYQVDQGYNLSIKLKKIEENKEKVKEKKETKEEKEQKEQKEKKEMYKEKISEIDEMVSMVDKKNCQAMESSEEREVKVHMIYRVINLDEIPDGTVCVLIYIIQDKEEKVQEVIYEYIKQGEQGIERHYYNSGHKEEYRIERSMTDEEIYKRLKRSEGQKGEKVQKIRTVKAGDNL